MTFEGAIIKEQGQTFAVVVVKEHVVRSSTQADRTISGFRRFFPGMPIVLMGQDYRGRATFYGRRDIAKFLSGISIRRIPWKKYTV